jgi:putative PIN family toxin of toxin-antitoxin system
MTRKPHLVLDTNVVISAVLWGGKPGELLALAGEGIVRLYTSRILLNELRTTLTRPKLARAVEATGLGVAEIVANYRRLAIVARARQLEAAISRDADDDDHVIACALAARADMLITGDDDLLTLEQVDGLPIRSVAASIVALM